MKISWKHLSKLVDLENISIKEAATKLTLAGLEVDSIASADKTKDTIFSIDITANRQDLVGWAQIATELSAILEKPLIIKNQLNNIHLVSMHDNNKKSELLSETYACILTNSNTSLKKRDRYLVNELEALGLNSTGIAILDAVNFINLKWGQSINVHELKQETNAEIKKLTIEVDYTVKKHEDKLKVWISNEELNRITEANISKYNNASNILLINYNNKKSNKNYCINAYLDILSLIQYKAEDKNKERLLSIYYSNKNAKDQLDYHINCTEKDINCLLGPVKVNGKKQLIDIQTISKIAQSLSLDNEYVNSGLRVNIPAIRRNDIKNKADIAEEIARIHGFNNFYDKLPQFNKTSHKSKIAATQQIIRKILRSMGLHEIINYSFQPRNEKNTRLHIVNSSSKDQASLRSNIVSGIMKAKKHNVNQGNNNFEVFEIGNIFTKNILNQKYRETTHVSWLLGNKHFNTSSWQSPKTQLTWLQAKGHTEELFERLNAKVSWTTSRQNNEFIESLKLYIHPTKSIYIQYKDQTIGVLSQLNNCSHSVSPNSYFTEIKLDQLIQSIETKSHLMYLYSHYSGYPKVTRDFSIKINRRTSMADINEAIVRIKTQEKNKIESIDLLSEYYNDQNVKTICLRINYRSKSKTLTCQEVKILDDILKSKLTDVLE